MKNRTNRLAMAVCVSVLGACASTGNQVIKGLDREGAASILQRGVSTKADVTLTLGGAKVNKFDSGYEVWTYRYNRVIPRMQSLIPIVGGVAGGSTEHTRELIILFDPSGIVTQYRVYDEVSGN